MKLIIVLLLLVSINFASTVNSYAVGKLKSPATAAKVRDRFKAQGEPLFLIHDSKKGVSVGDFIRFTDKMVLIDGQVWQTLAAEKALSNISDIPVTSMTGAANSSEWYKKSAVMVNQNSKKSYILGAEILKIFEEQFSQLPNKESVVITFTGGRATLLVPDQLISTLSLQRVVKSNKTGQMVWTVPPVGLGYLDYPLVWQAWAADPGEPSGSISYSLSGALPEGVRWNSSTHSIEGTPKSEGEFPLTIVARSANQRVSMPCTLSVSENSAPRWANIPDTLRIGEDSLLFPLIMSDFESPARQLTVEVSHIPLGFNSIDSLHHLIWKAGDFEKPIHDSVVLKVFDPMGKSTNYSVPVYYDRDGVDRGYTFASLTPPWDTLVEGVEYSWNIAREKEHWMRNHLDMTLGVCSDSVSLEDSIITMKPGSDSLFTVLFQFSDRGRDASTYELKLPVIRNRPPYFKAFPDKWDVEVFDLVFFEPEASDPEAEKVTIRLRSADSGYIWHDGRLSFSASSPGTYRAFLEAEDTFGNVSVQQVSYYVKQIYDRYRGFKLESGIWPGENSWNPNSWGFMNPWRLAWDTPAVRFGIFSPDDCNILNSKQFRFPFVYVGTELVPPHKRAEGKSVLVDVGATYNITSREMHTFGLMINVEARAYLERLFNSQTDFRFLFFARHLLRKVAVDLTINSDGSIDYNALKNLELLDEFVSTNNLNLFVGATQWFHLGSGFFAGPAFEMRTAPIAMQFTTVVDTAQLDSTKVILDRSKNIYTSFAGLGVRYDLKVNHFQFENQIKFGWGGDLYGMMVYWDTGIGFGRFKR